MGRNWGGTGEELGRNWGAGPQPLAALAGSSVIMLAFAQALPKSKDKKTSCAKGSTGGTQRIWRCWDLGVSSDSTEKMRHKRFDKTVCVLKRPLLVLLGQQCVAAPLIQIGNAARAALHFMTSRPHDKPPS